MNDENNNKDAQESRSDALSQILQLLELEVDIYHNAKVCGNWRIDEHTLGATCFHIVTEGNCLLDVPGHFKGILHYGDLAIFPRELPHNMLPQQVLSGEQAHLNYKDAINIEGTGLLCGEVRFQHRGSQYLLDSLPPVFIIRCDESNDWLKSLLQMIVLENMKMTSASKVILNQLSELLFTYSLRQYLNDKPESAGMLALYGDTRLAKVVNSIHHNPAKSWTLELMAKEASLSRSAFAESFKATSGWTAGQYLTWWRMQLAWSLLKKGDSVTQVADKVGYQSESALSRVFQKTFSISAGKVRRGLELS